MASSHDPFKSFVRAQNVLRREACTDLDTPHTKLCRLQRNLHPAAVDAPSLASAHQDRADPHRANPRFGRTGGSMNRDQQFSASLLCPDCVQLRTFAFHLSAVQRLDTDTRPIVTSEDCGHSWSLSPSDRDGLKEHCRHSSSWDGFEEVDSHPSR